MTTSNDELEELRKKVALSCQILAQHGLVKGSTGHVSVREPGTDNIFIRGRPRVDKGLRFAEADSVMRVGVEDSQPVGDHEGVARIGEIYLHTDLYKYRPDVNAVIHAHPPGVLMCTMNGVKLRPIFSGYEPGAMRIAMYDQAPVYDRSITLHTQEETSPFLDLFANHNMCLMTGHGIVVTGKSVEEATSRALTLEHLARINWLAHLGGGAPDISDEDKRVWLERDRETQRLAGSREGREGGGGWAGLLATLEHGGYKVDSIGLGFNLG
jgi:ribulose-5-phosphate 4-epimerase/fuculose-1-phosphate aldolase